MVLNRVSQSHAEDLIPSPNTFDRTSTPVAESHTFRLVHAQIRWKQGNVGLCGIRSISSGRRGYSTEYVSGVDPYTAFARSGISLGVQGYLVHKEPEISKRSVSVSYLLRNSVRTPGVRFLLIKKVTENARCPFLDY